jgi:hypothetical protein
MRYLQALSIFGIIFGFILLESPERFTDQLRAADTQQEVAGDEVRWV